jgi:hypothetical protein
MLAFTGSDDAIDASNIHIFDSRESCLQVCDFTYILDIRRFCITGVVDTIMGLVCDNRDSIDNSRSE